MSLISLEVDLGFSNIDEKTHKNVKNGKNLYSESGYGIYNLSFNSLSVRN